MRICNSIYWQKHFQNLISRKLFKARNLRTSFDLSSYTVVAHCALAVSCPVTVPWTKSTSPTLPPSLISLQAWDSLIQIKAYYKDTKISCADSQSYLKIIKDPERTMNTLLVVVTSQSTSWFSKVWIIAQFWITSWTAEFLRGLSCIYFMYLLPDLQI